MTDSVRELVLHIGTGKTGTSSLQFFLHHNRARLLELGSLYPRSPGNARHTRLGLYLKSDAELGQTPAWQRIRSTPEKFREAFPRQLRVEIEEARPSRVVLSDEALYGLSDHGLGQLRQLTRALGPEIRVVVYLRRQDDHLVSRYQQVVKLGGVNRLQEQLDQSRSPRTYDYMSRLATWQRLVEPDTLVVRRFERASFAAGSLYQDFLDAAGLDLPESELEHVEIRNESLDAEALEMLRLLNVWRREHPDAAIPSNQRLVPRLIAVPSGPTLTLPDERLEPFMAQWEESNRAVARTFLHDPHGELFTKPRRTEHTTSAQRLDPARLDVFLEALDLPEPVHGSLRRIVAREASP